jgi:uncharacterized membrane protein
MALDISVFFAALGITTLEIVEASAVGLALYADSKRPAAFLYVSAGVLAIFIPLFVVGKLLALLPLIYVELIGAVLMFYFGQRLVKSARRSVLNARKNKGPVEHHEAHIAVTGFSVGAIEAFEASIVLVALIPINFGATSLGMMGGIVVVVIGTYLLRNHVRRIKQANMKVVVAALLLSFGTFWLIEVSGTSLANLQDLLILPLFVVYAFAVHKLANRPSPSITVAA